MCKVLAAARTLRRFFRWSLRGLEPMQMKRFQPAFRPNLWMSITPRQALVPRQECAGGGTRSGEFLRVLVKVPPTRLNVDTPDATKYVRQ